MIRKDENYLADLVKYIDKNFNKGYSKESLKWALVKQGHSKIEVEKAFKLHEAENTKKIPKPVQKTDAPINLQNLVVEKPEKKSFWKKIFGS